MREILFRGKTLDGEWVEGDYLNSGYDYKTAIRKKGFDGGVNYAEVIKVIPESIGQYTGLTDKNGTKIFEGDIVRYNDEENYYPEEQCEFFGEIVFEKGAFGIATNDIIPIDLEFWCGNDYFVSLWELYWNLSIESEMLDMVEVIGNIHDNPELLKGGAE